jgi:hypothetical protein
MRPAGECKVYHTDGVHCETYWYIRNQAVHDFATASLVTMTLDTILTMGSLSALKAILRLEQVCS